MAIEIPRKKKCIIGFDANLLAANIFTGLKLTQNKISTKIPQYQNKLPEQFLQKLSNLCVKEALDKYIS